MFVDALSHSLTMYSSRLRTLTFLSGIAVEFNYDYATMQAWQG